MKQLLDFSEKADLDTWRNYFLVVDNIPDDPDTGLARCVVADGPFIMAERQKVEINAVIYCLDNDGNPINGRVQAKKSLFPRQEIITADNSYFVALDGTFRVLSANELPGLTYGVDYLEEFEAYRQYAKGNPINIFALMENSIRQSSKI